MSLSDGVPNAAWRRDSLPYDKRPCRQFVWLSGERFHSGVRWRRDVWGIAFIRPDNAEDGWLGYRAEDIRRLEEEGDMDAGTAEVFGWLPAATPAYFDMAIRVGIVVNAASGIDPRQSQDGETRLGPKDESPTAEKRGRPNPIGDIPQDV